MSTTNLFVELVVIGAGAALWVVLLMLALLGVPTASGELAWLADKEVGIPLLLAILPVVYVLGIVTDRAADQFFDRWFRAGDRWRLHYTDRNHYFQARRYLLHESTPFTKELEYERSRLRICRGWTLDALGLLATWVLYWDLQRPAGIGVGLVVAAALALLVAGLFWSWYNLNQAQVKKLRRKADWLYERENERRRDEGKKALVRFPSPRENEKVVLEAEQRAFLRKRSFGLLFFLVGVFVIYSFLRTVYCFLSHGSPVS